jgi:hypothetical protein
MPRLDYLRECHSQVTKQVKENLTFDVFSEAYCTRCFQPECTRSAHGATKFDQRVATWQDRLFLKVPRMDQNDPRFESISSKEFAPVQETLIVRGWGEEITPEPQREITPEPPQEVAIEEIPANPEPSPVYFQPSSSTASISRDTLLMNTPVSNEQYLPGAPRPSEPHNSPKKNIDSWGAPEQSTPSEVVVKAGATVRFGSGSGVSK